MIPPILIDTIVSIMVVILGIYIINILWKNLPEDVKDFLKTVPGMLKKLITKKSTKVKEQNNPPSELK